LLISPDLLLPCRIEMLIRHFGNHPNLIQAALRRQGSFRSLNPSIPNQAEWRGAH
jgi:hypothetical protein